MNEIENKAIEFINWLKKHYKIKSEDDISNPYIKALYIEVIENKKWEEKRNIEIEKYNKRNREYKRKQLKQHS